MRRQTKFLRYSFFAYLFVLGLSGVALILSGAAILWLISDFFYFADNKVLASPMIMVLNGGLVLFVTFVGYHTTIKQSYEFLTPFTILLLATCIIELSVGTIVTLSKMDFESSVRQSMGESMLEYRPYTTFGKHDDVNNAWNNLHSEFKCCGIDSALDWYNVSSEHDQSNGVIPDACCPGFTLIKRCSIFTIPNYWKPVTKGCFEIFSSRMKIGNSLMIGIGFGFAMIEIIGIVFVRCFASWVTKGKPSCDEVSRIDEDLCSPSTSVDYMNESFVVNRSSRR